MSVEIHTKDNHLKGMATVNVLISERAVKFLQKASEDGYGDLSDLCVNAIEETALDYARANNLL